MAARWARILGVLVALALAGGSNDEEVGALWAVAATFFNAGDYAQAILQIDRCLAAVEPASPLVEQLRAVRETAASRLVAATASLEARAAAPRVTEWPADVGAFPDPPAATPAPPRASDEPCGDGVAGAAQSQVASECEGAAAAPPVRVLEAAATCGASTPTRAAANATLGVCAYVHHSSNAALFDWAHAQLCAGVSRIELRDDRQLPADERELARWMLAPLVAADSRLSLVEMDDSGADVGDVPASRAGAGDIAVSRAGAAGACVASTETEWAFRGSDAGWAITPRARAPDLARGGARREAFWRDCVGRLGALSWVALAEAPSELLLPHRDAPASRAGPADPPVDLARELDAHANRLCPRGMAAGDEAREEGGRARAEGVASPDVVVAAVRVPFAELGEFDGDARIAAATAARAPRHRPTRPTLATHVYRPSSFGTCALRVGEAQARASAGGESAGGQGGSGVCLERADGMLVLRTSAARARGHTPLTLMMESAAPIDGSAGAPRPAAARAVRTLTGSAPSGRERARERDVVDMVGRWHVLECDARALTVHTRQDERARAPASATGADAPAAQAEAVRAALSADAAAALPWVSEALARVTSGEGVALLPAVGNVTLLRRVRASFLAALPEKRQHGVTQAFASSMCQTIVGVPQMAGYSPACAPVDPLLFAFAHDAHALALARALLGDDAILHNAGVSLVGDGSTSTVEPHQDQPLPTGRAGTWRGRVPPYTHPLALQILWPLDPFAYENGATFLLPRTQARAERLDKWVRNGTDVLDARGLFAVRFATAEPGDLVLLLGSAWHGASSHVRAPRALRRPRVALLFEYAPSFVAPQHRYHPDVLGRYVPEQHRELFPAIDTAGARAAADGARGAPDAACADGALDAPSVFEFARLMRERAHCARLSTRVLLRAGRGAMPAFGLGTGSADDDPDVIAAALRAGYRLVDTAALYANERIVAEGLRRSGVHREAVFLTSKTGAWCPGWYQTPRGTMARAVCIGGREDTARAVRASLEALGLSYLDLFLLHWPMSASAGLESDVLADGSRALRLDDPAHAAAREGAWRALLELRAAGAVRAVGVSNFSVRQLEQLRAATGELPDVLQIELHPLLQRAELRAYCERHGILVQAYGNRHEAVTSHPALRHLAAGAPALALLAPQPEGVVSMRWALQSGAAVLSRSRKLEYIAANQQVFWPGFRHVLTPGVMHQMRALDANMSLHGAHHLFVEDRIA
ncbi:hypothetical protein KFE25_000601 [Diacronema lutheri]|uniref:NADP-dependent oxidoreductase domain-containing protein n=1 Tax=Diacronema lutheri TaxID=2081491 RepID=A0A8J6CEU6_DIALT|nr:hypothetical protein KFE25_000601 [Diacronema lutheri]